MRLSKLKDLRRDSGLSQEELAHASGVSRATICDLENLRRSCWPQTAAKLADALDVYVVDLSLGQTSNSERARMRALQQRNDELVSVIESFMDAMNALDVSAMRDAALTATMLLADVPPRDKE